MKIGASRLNKKVLLTLGFATVTALASTNTGLADCGGLFLLHLSDKQFSAKACSVKDTFETNNLTVHGSFYHAAIQGRYTDKWHIKGLNRFDVVSAGFESRYKYVTIGADVYSFPIVSSRVSVHREDSLIRVNAGIARGALKLGTISWVPDQTTEMIGTIPVEWETHFLYRHLSAESKYKNHYANLSLSHIKTSPRNPDKERYIRDSVNVLVLGAQYGHDFSRSRLEAGYIFADADATLFGIFHQETSYKRFLYFPIDASLHLGFTRWEWEQLKTHLEYVHLSGKLYSDANRFYETLAPNRALSASLIKGLSFAFLQKAFRMDADLNAFAVLSGATYQWKLGSSYEFVPSAGLDFFGASGDLDINKKTETIKTFGTTNSYYEKTNRKLNSIGSILSLGCAIHKKGNVTLSLDYGITQIIPFYIDYKDYNSNQAEEPAQQGSKGGNKGSGKSGSKSSENTQTSNPTKDRSGSLERSVSALLFRNGFATHLSVGVKF